MKNKLEKKDLGKLMIKKRAKEVKKTLGFAAGHPMSSQGHT